MIKINKKFDPKLHASFRVYNYVVPSFMFMQNAKVIYKVIFKITVR